MKVCFWVHPERRSPFRSLPWDPHHDFNNNLCGSLVSAVVRWSDKPEEVTCARCLELLQTQPRAAEQRAPDSGDAGKGTPSAPSSPVDRPSHYTAGSVECIDAIDAAVAHLSGAEGFYVGQVVKYIWRWQLKNGVEDLKKAKWYLERLISKVETK